MIPRDVEILYEKKQLVLEQQAQSSAIVSNFVAGSIQSQVSKESALSKTIRWRFFSTAGSASTSSQVVFGWSISPQLYFQHKVEHEVKEHEQTIEHEVKGPERQSGGSISFTAV